MNSRTVPADVTRASLLLRLRAKGTAREIAWVEFHNLYAPIIAGFARRMGAAPQDVDDLVQEVLSAFFCVRPEFTYDPVKGRFRGYLKTCVWSKLAALRRKRGIAGASIEHHEPDDVAVEIVWNDVWETEKLGRALAVVRERYSVNAERQRTFRTFELCTLLDRSAEEVAAELGMSAESVRAAKLRVSKALRQAFDQLDELTG
jgi:RNA polymerase sigma factor (sigma-70 family)